jgi:hypothetical protein
MDVANAGIIFPYLLGDRTVMAEFLDIQGILHENHRNRELYCKAEVSNKAKDVFEMRFTRNQRNDRIYCKEFHEGKKRHIVMVELFQGKKSQDIPKKIKQRLENIGGSEYELEK